MAEVKMVPVIDSKSIEAVGHDGQHLHITYRGGRGYIYKGVSPETYDDLLKAPSKGTFLNAHIRKQGLKGVAK